MRKTTMCCGKSRTRLDTATGEGKEDYADANGFMLCSHRLSFFCHERGCGGAIGGPPDPRGGARRARVILMLAEGASYSIEATVPCYRDFINRWRRAFWPKGRRSAGRAL